MSEPVGAPNSTVAAHTALSMVAVFALGVTRLVFSLLVGHQLGADVLGRVNTQLSIATFASLVAASSTSIAVSKFVSAGLGGADRLEARRVLLTLLRWCVVGTAAITALLALVLSWTFARLSLIEVAATCLLFVAYSAYLFVRGAQYGYGTVRRYVLIETTCDAVAIAAAVIVVFLGAELVLLLPFIIGYTLFAVLGWVGLPRPAHAPAQTQAPAPPLRAELRQEMLGYAGWAAIGVVASTGFLQLSMVFAYYYNDEFRSGLFAAAFNLTVPAYFVPRALSMALFPAMAGTFGRGDTGEVRRQLYDSTIFLLVGALPFFAAGVFFAEPILTLLFGARYADAHLILEMLLTATYVMIVAIPAVNALSATDRALARIPAGASAAGFSVGLAVWLALGPSHGPTAIAVGYLAGAVVASAIGMVAASRHWHWEWSRLLLRASLVVGVAAGLRALAGLTQNGLLVRLGCTLAVAAITVLACLPETRHIIRRLGALTSTPGIWSR